MKRKMVKIDEDRCNGCGLCVPSCAEGAIQIIDGKAKLVADNLCDGLGACLGECPFDAISIEEREADDFDELAVERHLKKMGASSATANNSESPKAFSGCPSAKTMSFNKSTDTEAQQSFSRPSRLTQWPIQLHLVPPTAPFFKNADVVLAADCAPFAYADFQEDLLKGKALAIACPKLDDTSPYVDKLTTMIRESNVRSLTVIHMEVPCCNGLIFMAKQAIVKSGRDIPFETVCIGINGEKKT